MDSEQLGAGLAPAPEDKKDEKSKEIAPINKDDDDTIEAVRRLLQLLGHYTKSTTLIDYLLQMSR